MTAPGCTATRGMPCRNLPGRAGEQSSPAPRQSISNCPDEFGGKIQSAGGNPPQRSAVQTCPLASLTQLQVLSQFKKKLQSVDVGEVGECDSLVYPVRGRLSSGSSLPGRGLVEQQQGRCLITSTHFLAAEVKERAGRRRRSQSAVGWRAAQEGSFLSALRWVSAIHSLGGGAEPVWL